VYLLWNASTRYVSEADDQASAGWTPDGGSGSGLLTMNIQLNVSDSSKETGEILVRYLTDRGLVLDRESGYTICYGGTGKTTFILNRGCGMNKITRMERMNNAGVRLIPWSSTGEGLHFPLLARKAHGFGGTDIVPVFQPEELPWRIAAGWDWFSEYMPLVAEYRVWVFREKHLDTYEKVMQRPEEYKYIGRNFRNGFEFRKVNEIPEASRLARLAVASLVLDFGAVDILLGKDRLFRVLEVNTAPGVIRSHAEPTLAKLADEMVLWRKGL
jgi:hypothetical protein